MHVEPITCWRPTAEAARRWAAPPYDVFTDEGARAYVEAHPGTFLAVDRAETTLAPGIDPHSPAVYERVATLLREAATTGVLVRDDTPCYYAYRLSHGAHSQLGVVGAVGLGDLADGTIRRHEDTLPAKVADRMAHIAAAGAQTGPVLLAYRDVAALDVLVGLAATGEPLYDLSDDDGVRHTIWRIARRAAVEAISATFGQVDAAYLADGHHRAAASASLCEARVAAGDDPGAAQAFLAVLFGAGSLRVLPYNRVVADTGSLTLQALLDAIVAQGFAVCEHEEAAVPRSRGTFGMFVGGLWYLLKAHNVPSTFDDPVAALDASILQSRILAPVLGIDDPTTSERIVYVPGSDGVAGLERLVGDTGVAFSLFPTSVADLMAVSDANLLMPPKSTWFAPKPLSGLFLRRV